MIRVVLPAHLRTLALVAGEVSLEVDGPVTVRSVLDALEAAYPALRGTIRDVTNAKLDRIGLAGAEFVRAHPGVALDGVRSLTSVRDVILAGRSREPRDRQKNRA